MKVKHYILDTNVLLRFFTDDHPKLSPAAKAVIAEAVVGHVILELVPVIIAEVVYTLSSYYGKGNEEIAKTLLGFIGSSGVKTHERTRLIDALKRFGTQRVDFADAYLAAVAADTQIPIASLDRDFDKFKDISWVEPSSF